MNIINNGVTDVFARNANHVELQFRKGLTLTIMEYSNKGVIVVTSNLYGELSRILISSEHGHVDKILAATTMERLATSLAEKIK